MAKTNNLKDFLMDLADAIREKEGSNETINPQDFSNRIKALSGGGNEPSEQKWTGHADAEGLRAIGWTEEDIAYYQEHGVNWNAEEDEYHKVSDDNKALYGVLTADNIQTYKDRIVYLPKIDTSAKTSMLQMFLNCYYLVAIPMLNTSNVTNMQAAFQYCYQLVCIPPLDTNRVTTMYIMFANCYSLRYVPQLDTSNVTSMSNMFNSCQSLNAVPKLNTQNVTSMTDMFNCCRSLMYIPQLDVGKITSFSSNFCADCRALTTLYIKNLKASIQLTSSLALNKWSLIYIINNEAATSSITIKLTSVMYNKLSVDEDVVAALAAHPNLSISA